MHIIFHIAAQKISRTELRSDGKKAFTWSCEGEELSKALQDKIDSWMQAYVRGDDPGADLPLDLRGIPPFTLSVYKALRRIRRGHPASYAAIAQQVGNPRASRAVGSACRRNPFLLIIPCHRVIASDGSLGGFAAGLPLKEALLSHEKN